MQPEPLLEMLENLNSDYDFRHCTIMRSSELIASAEEINKRLIASEWNSAQGWIARQSGVTTMPGNDDPSLGAVLEAELGSQNTSIQIRRISGQWALTTLTEQLGGEMLADDVVLVTTLGKAARYRRYWDLPEDGASEIVACRLVCFEEII